MDFIDFNKFSKEKALYVVATPIGNLEDVTFRALKTLKHADLILCEDTRVSKKLLSHYGISAQLESFNDHNGTAKIARILSLLEDGQSIALISDAGTPLISDPGYRLVLECHNAGIKVVPIAGASSLTAALCACGMATDSFSFFGFFDPKKMTDYNNATKILVFFESAKRLQKTLHKIATEWGNETQAVVARELTKLHEEFVRGSATEVAQHFDNHVLRGEIVLVVQRPEATITPEKILSELQIALKNNKLNQASAIVAEKLKISKKQVYEIGLKQKEQS